MRVRRKDGGDAAATVDKGGNDCCGKGLPSPRAGIELAAPTNKQQVTLLALSGQNCFLAGNTGRCIGKNIMIVLCIMLFSTDPDMHV